MSLVQPRHASTSSDENKETTNAKSVLQILNPVITLMRVCGVCIGPCVTVENTGCSDYRFRLLHKDDWFQIFYCVLGNAYVWIYSGLLAYKLAMFEPMSSEWIIVFQFLAMNITASTAHSWVSLNFREGICQSWAKDFYLYEQCHGVHEHMETVVQKSKKVVAFFTSFVMSIPVCMLTYALFIPEVGEMSFVVDKTLGRWNYLITFINYFILAASLASSMGWSVIGSYHLCSELDVLNTIMTRCTDYIQHHETLSLSSESASERHYEDEQLRAIIVRHKRICSLISEFGDLIAYLPFTAFFMSLPLSCFSLYVIMTRMESQSNVVLCTLILVICCGACIVLSTTGVRVNVKAHAALQCMLKIPTTHLSESTMRAVNQFTSLLTGTTIGYSVFGLFTISPSTVLSIVGTLVTYVVVVLQFRQPDSQTSLNTLCQNLVANITVLLGDMHNASLSP